MDVPLRTLLVRPRAAFAAADDPGLLQPAVLTLLTGVVSTVTVLPLYVLVARELPPTVPRVRFATGSATAAIPRGLLVGMALAMVLVGVFWVVTTGALALGATPGRRRRSIRSPARLRRLVAPAPARDARGDSGRRGRARGHA